MISIDSDTHFTPFDAFVPLVPVIITLLLHFSMSLMTCR